MNRKPLLFISLFLALLTSGCSDFDTEHKTLMSEGIDKLLIDSELYPHKSSDYEFNSTRVSDGNYSYDITFESDGRLSSLNKDKILSLFVEAKDRLYRKSVSCGKNITCDFKSLLVTEGVDEYEILFDLRNEVSINGDDYDGDEQEYVFRPSSNDEETYIDGKSGSDWLSLTDNQKFHAVSNALYSLSINGYTIEGAEQYYIDLLDNYFSGVSDKNKSLSKTLAEIGMLSGTIYK